MICIHCGKTIGLGDKICKYCGKLTEFRERFDYQPSEAPIPGRSSDERDNNTFMKQILDRINQAETQVENLAQKKDVRKIAFASTLISTIILITVLVAGIMLMRGLSRDTQEKIAVLEQRVNLLLERQNEMSDQVDTLSEKIEASVKYSISFNLNLPEGEHTEMPQPAALLYYPIDESVLYFPFLSDTENYLFEGWREADHSSAFQPGMTIPVPVDRDILYSAQWKVKNAGPDGPTAGEMLP